MRLALSRGERVARIGRVRGRFSTLPAARGGRRDSERGQSVVFVLLALSLFLLAAVGFTVDLANLWFHRQMAQSAADAACTAGAMDMYAIDSAALSGSTAPTGAHFTQGTNFDCGSTTPNTMSSTSTTPTPCQYAAVNGYTSPSTYTGLVAGTPSNNVYVTFPSASSSPVPGVTGAPSTLAPYPFMRVDVLDRVKVFFMALLTGSKTQDVRAFAVCGLIYPPAVDPITSLNVNENGNSTSPGQASLDMDNDSTLTIIGGPPVSIAISSSFATNAANLSTDATINLAQGGPNRTGSIMVDSGALKILGGGVTCGAITPCVVASACVSAGSYCATGSSTASIDPYSLTPAPVASSSSNGTISSTSVASGTNGCPAPSGKTCVEFTAGLWPNGIGTTTATGSAYLNNPSSATYVIFDPGVYFVTGGMIAWGNVCIRPSTATGNGSGGTMFYFSDNKSISISTLSTTCSAAAAFNSSLTNCPGNTSTLPSLPLTGDVFLGPCTGTWGDPLASSDPAGEQRGTVFFQNRNQTPTANQNCVTGVITGSSPCLGPLIGGAGSVLSVGTMYFHQCHASGGVDSGGTNCTAAATGANQCSSNPGGTGYCTNVWFSGSASTTSAGLGNIVADNIRMTASSALTMNINPNAYVSILKVGLLR